MSWNHRFSHYNYNNNYNTCQCKTTGWKLLKLSIEIWFHTEFFFGNDDWVFLKNFFLQYCFNKVFNLVTANVMRKTSYSIRYSCEVV